MRISDWSSDVCSSDLKLDAGPGELRGILLELRLEPLEQREGVGRRPGESSDDLAVGESPHLAGVRIADGLAEADLPVAGDDDGLALADGTDGRALPGHADRKSVVYRTSGSVRVELGVRRLVSKKP